MIPWLVLDGISALIMILFMTTVDMNDYAQKMGGIANYSESFFYYNPASKWRT